MPDKFIDIIYKRFQRALDYDKRKAYEESLEIAQRAFKGHIFSASEEKAMEDDGIPVVPIAEGTTNALRLASILTASRPELKAVPIGSGDGPTATIIGRAFKRIWDGCGGNRTNFNIVLGTIKNGLDHFNCSSERYGLRGDVKIKFGRTGPKKIYYDPGTTEDDLSDWRIRILAKPISKQEALNLGVKENELYYELIEKPEDAQSGETTSHDSRPGGAYDDAPSGSPTETKRNIWEIEHWEQNKYVKKMWFDRETQMAFLRYDNVNKDNQNKINAITSVPSQIPNNERFEKIEITEYELEYSYVVGKKIFQEKIINPYGIDSQGDPVDPLISLPNIPIDELYPRGNMYFAEGPLKEITKRRGQSIALVAHQMGSPIVAKKGTVNLEEWRKKVSRPREVLEAEWEDPADKPGTLYNALPDLSRVFQLEDRARASLNDVFNLTPILKGEAETGRMSGRLATMLKENGLEGNSYLITTAEWAFRKLGICLLVMALNDWPMRYWERLLEEEDYRLDENGDPSQDLLPGFVKALEKIRAKQVDIIDYDIGIRAGSSLPTNRLAKLDMAMELAKEPVHPDAVYDAEAILRYTDDPQSKEILKRKSVVRKLSQEKQQILGDFENLAKQHQETAKQLELLQNQVDKLRINHTEDMGKAKFRYETTIQKTVDKYKAEIQRLNDAHDAEIAILKMQMDNAVSKQAEA